MNNDPTTMANALSLMSLNLPDPNQELSLQLFDKFHHFPNFPIELRLAIWRLRFPPSRRVYLNCNNATPPYKKHLHGLKPPISLSICQESRQDTLRYYKVFYHMRSKIYMFIDMKKDVIRMTHDFFMNHHILESWTPDFIDAVKEVRTLEVMTDVWGYHEKCAFKYLGRETLTDFSGLRELRLFIPDSRGLGTGAVLRAGVTQRLGGFEVIREFYEDLKKLATQLEDVENLGRVKEVGGQELSEVEGERIESLEYQIPNIVIMEG